MCSKLSVGEALVSLTEAQTCVILHPGSKYLRIGRPSDSFPQTVLHAIACRKKEAALSYNDPFLIPIVDLDKETSTEIEDCRLKVSYILQSSLTSDGFKRFATPPQQVAAFNKTSQPLICDSLENVPDWSLPAKKVPDWSLPVQEFIVGDEILNLKPGSNYNIHFPYKRGDLNIHSNIGGSITNVLSFIEIIWKHCITTLLNIPVKDLKFYRAVLVIPNIYKRDYVKKLVNLLLCDLGFGSCFIVQDHVAATFGSGLSCVCVVDVGDQKTSISCVEDAISHPSTRLRLDYGGADLTQVFHWLLKKSGFPLNIDQTCSTDVALLNDLKHEFCHINLNIVGPQEKEFTLRRPGQVPLKYRVQMGDELLIAPLSFSYPDLLRITGPKSTLTQRPFPSDPDDPLDETFLRETSRMRGREMEVNVFDSVEGEDEMVDEHVLPSLLTDKALNKTEASVFTVDKLQSIEQAILTSIERCPTDELKRKMYSTILVVGGGAKFEHFGNWLTNQLNLQIPVQFRSEPVEIITKPKDLDPAVTVWKGASLMTCLEGNSDLWILKGEWVRFGVKILREKCPFIW